MHYLIYKITNTINQKIYIGAHQTDDVNDSYMGSGRNIKLAIKKYGKDNFTKEILHDFNNPIDMYEKEREIVTEDFVKQTNTYNCNVGGRGGSYIFLSEDEKQQFIDKISKSQIERYANGAEPWNKGRIVPDDELVLMRERMVGKMVGVDNPMYGKPCYYKMTPDEKKTWSEGIRKGNTGKKRTEEHKKNYSKAASLRMWLVHRSGKATHTQDPQDPRFDDPDWQRGKKWKN